MRDPRLRRPPATGCRRAARSGRAGSRGRRPTARSRPTDRGGGKHGRGRRARALCPDRAPVGLRATRPRRPTPALRQLARAASARGDRSARQRRQRNSRSGSLPPRPRSVSSTATSAAAAAKPRSRASISMCARRGSSGSAGDRAAVVGDSPVGIDRAEDRQALARLVDRGSRRRVEEGQARADRPRPTAGR